MLAQALKKVKLPDTPGVYEFLGSRNEILYIGKATSLRDRVRSYFANDLLHTRGKHIVDMVTMAKGVRFTKTESVLDAIILEASMIKKHQPVYNTKEKDDKSWNYVVITKEDFPRVLTLRERPMAIGGREKSGEFEAVFGPFTQGGSLAEALKIIRRIFPYRDTCSPAQTGFRGESLALKGLSSETAGNTVNEKGHRRPVAILEQRVSVGKPERRPLPRGLTFPSQGETSGRLSGRPCFNRQIGLCPGVCTGEISKQEYAERVREIAMLLGGKKRALIVRLKRLMRESAKHFEFEKAGEYRNMVFALEHLRDVSLIKEEIREVSRKSATMRRRPFRIEAYDIAHISGKYTVGVMTVVLDGRPEKAAYRKFKNRVEAGKNDDLLHLEEVLRRRFRHVEWPAPDLVVIDGGVAQKRRAEAVLRELGKEIPVVSVVKDERHKPKAMLGNKELAESYRRGILIANGEAHRFAVAYHRQLRGKLPRMTA